MAIELAKAYLPIVPSLKGVKANLEKELAPISQSLGIELGQTLGKSTSSGLGKALTIQLPKELSGAVATLGKDLGKVGQGMVSDLIKGVTSAKPAQKMAQVFEKTLDTVTAPARKATANLNKLVAEAQQVATSTIEKAVTAAAVPAQKATDALGKLADKALKPGRNFVAGFRDTADAQAAFTGRLGTIGGKVRKLSDLMIRPGHNFVQGLKSTAAAESSFTGIMGSLGGRVTQLSNSFTKFGGNLKQSFSTALGGISFDALIQRGEAAGRQAGHMITTGLKTGVAAAGTAVAGIIGTSLIKGFNRLSAIENAEAKLSGLGNSAEDVSSIMSNALAAVKGTAFGMDEAATTAASAVAAGIAPGMELERYLKLVGDAATIAGTDMASMGSIFNKVATSGKVQGDVFAQLSDAGIPVVQMLAKSIGVSAEEVYKLGSEGKISSEQFLEAMSSMEGAALKGGDTTTGAFKNMNAALSRFGAALLKEIYPLVGPVFGEITKWIESATTVVGPLAQAVSLHLLGAFQQAAAWAREFTASLVENKDILLPLLAGVGASVAVWAGWQLALQLATGATNLFAWAVKGVNAALTFATSPLGMVVLAVGALVAGVMLAYNHIGWFRDLVDAAWAQIQVAIGQVVDWWTSTAWPAIETGLKTLGDWFTWLWQEIVSPAFAAIGQVIQNAWASYIQPALMAIWSFIQDPLAPIFTWLWQNIITPAFQAIVGIIRWAWENIIVPLFNFVVGVVRNVLAPVFTWLWNNIITPVWNGIVLAIQVAWKVIELVFGLIQGFLKNILGPAFTWLWEKVISPVWTWISDKISAVSGFLTNTVFPKLQGAVDVLKRAFEAAKDGIGKAWDTLREIVAAPIRFVVNTVINDGIIAGYNKFNDFWSGKDLDPIRLGFKVGGYTGDGPADQVAGLVHKGEYVLPKSATQALIRERGMGFLESLRHYGAAAGGHSHSPGTYCAHCAGAPAGHSTTASTAGAPPSGASGIWGGFQQQVARAGRLFIPKMNFMGVNTENVARAWMGRSAVEIIAGSGSPSISFHTGGAGTWGFNAGSNIWMQHAVPAAMREAVLIHELGHALSLHHTMNGGSIMHPLVAGPRWPSALDYGALVRAWGAPGEGVKTYDGGGGGFSILDKVAELVSAPAKKLLGAARERFSGNGFMEIPIGLSEKMLDQLVDWVSSKGADGAAGGIRPTLYDKGGIIDRGIQVIDHQRTTPDYVLTDRQWQAMYEIAQNSAVQQPGLSIGAVYGHSADEVADAILRRQQQAHMLAL